MSAHPKCERLELVNYFITSFYHARITLTNYYARHYINYDNLEGKHEDNEFRETFIGNVLSSFFLENGCMDDDGCEIEIDIPPGKGFVLFD